MPNNKHHRHNRIQGHATACLCVVGAVLLLLAGCQRSGEEVHFHRLDRLLFTTPPERLQEVLMSHRDEFATDLIRIYPNDPEYIAWVQGFVTDPTMQDIYRTTDSLFGNLGGVERQLGRALARARKCCPEMVLPSRFYTMVTGDYDNYDNRVFTGGSGSDLCVALDLYALGTMKRYAYFGIPHHITRLCVPDQLVPDCMRAMAADNIAWPESGQTLLDYAVAEGKVLYFVEQTLPHLADTTLLRYTADQLQWMRDNTSNVWGWILQNKMLYSTDMTQLRNILDDAPHTNAFGAGSAPRTATYIGWQIVRSYMKRSGATMQDLFANTDSQQILTASAWRP